MSEKISEGTENSFRIEIPFDEVLQKAFLEASFDYQTVEEKKKGRRLIVLFGMLMVLGCLLAYEQGGAFTFGHVIVFGSGFYFFSAINFFSQVRKEREIVVSKELERLKAISGEKNTIILELTDSHYFIADSEMSLSLKWSYFSHFVLSGNYLFLHYKNGQVTGISRAILGMENFDRALKIIKVHLKQNDLKSDDSLKTEPNELLDENLVQTED